MKKVKLIILPIIILSLILIGCFPRGKIILTGKKYAPYNGPVKVFNTLPSICEEYPLLCEEIGLVSANADFAFQWTSLIEIMQKKAASCGANAIMIIHRERIRHIREIRAFAIRIHY